jgi:hypothetical protein
MVHSSFLVQAQIVDYVVPHLSVAPVCNRFHDVCDHPLTMISSDLPEEEFVASSPLQCEFCSCPVPSDQIVSVFTHSWIIDDQSGNRVTVQASPSCHTTIIELTAFEFQSLSPPEYDTRPFSCSSDTQS